MIEMLGAMCFYFCKVFATVLENFFIESYSNDHVMVSGTKNNLVNWAQNTL